MESKEILKEFAGKLAGLSAAAKVVAIAGAVSAYSGTGYAAKEGAVKAENRITAGIAPTNGKVASDSRKSEEVSAKKEEPAKTQVSEAAVKTLLASKEKETVISEAQERISQVAPQQFIRDPFVLEFLNLKDYPSLHESVLEQALIDHLQQFLLELGRGFCFVARQKLMRYGDDDFYVDLVFYHSILKCHVLIDLKLGKLTHEDVGQMDSYIRMFEALYRNEDDNPTLGIILCSQKSEAIVKYSVLSEGKQIFASRYKLYLPTEEEFKQLLESI